MKIVANQLLKKLICLIISVLTIPGCTAFTVTLVPVKKPFKSLQKKEKKIPSSLFANSLVNNTLANLL